MYDDTFVIGDKFIAGLNTVCRAAIKGILVERKFPVGHGGVLRGQYLYNKLT